jgi:hypothetical protein
VLVTTAVPANCVRSDGGIRYPDLFEPTLLVGDLNEWRPGRKSALHELRPVFGPLSHGHFSFPSYFPVVALDRVIGSPGLVTAMQVHDSALAQVAYQQAILEGFEAMIRHYPRYIVIQNDVAGKERVLDVYYAEALESLPERTRSLARR